VSGPVDDERRGADEPWDEDTWTEADERRYQQRRAEERAAARRRVRHGVVFTLLVLVVLGAGTTAAGVYQGWWEWPPWEGLDEPAPVRTVVACPTPEVTAAPVADVTLTVLNSTSRTGLAGDTAAQLTERGFTVGAIGNDPGGPISGTAVVRHGPEGLLAARTVAAHVPGAELMDDGRAGAAVELSLGESFEGLGPPEEAAALLEPEPAPSPPGCVPLSPETTAPTTPAATTPPPTG
jgi:hypothetical protein